jgi:hypothetical protein
MFGSISTAFLRGALLVGAVLLVTAPAHAIDGRTAVGVCIDSTASGARCAWSVNGNGEIDICNKNGCVYCKNADSQCVKAARGRPRPTRPLPVGTKIIVPMLGVLATPKPYTGSILGFRCIQGFRMCPGHGCVGPHDSCDPVR